MLHDPTRITPSYTYILCTSFSPRTDRFGRSALPMFFMIAPFRMAAITAIAELPLQYPVDPSRQIHTEDFGEAYG